MPTREEDFEELKQRVSVLTQRVWELERKIGGASASAPAATRSAVPPPQSPPAERPPAPPAPHYYGTPLQQTVAAQAAAPEARDLESRIGSQWLNRIGIIAVLTGSAYFLKLAFDNDWIGPAGRIAIGLLAGIGLVVWAQLFFRKGYKGFSYSLAAAGLGVMYLSLWAAFQLYHLLPSAVAFLAMVLVTATAASIALRNDAEILAAVALAGGFATPVLVSTGQDHEVTLFAYVALLDVFCVGLIALRPWRRLLIGSFLGTLALYSGWYGTYYTNAAFVITAFFTTLFFIIFAALPFVQQMRPPLDSSTGKSMLSIAVVNPAVFFIQLYSLTDGRPAHHWMPWIAVVLAGFYIASANHLAGAPEGEEQVRATRWLHLAIGLGFLTIAVPLKLEGHWITIGWLVESALLLYVAERARSRFLHISAVIALSLGIFRMLVLDDYGTERLFFNMRFATYLVALAVLGLLIWYSRRSSEPAPTLILVASIAFNALALLALSAEIRDFYDRSLRNRQLMSASAPPDFWRDLEIARDFTYSALYMLYGGALIAIGFIKRNAPLRWQALLLIAFTITKVFLYDSRNLNSGLRVVSFIVLGVLLLAVSFAYQRDWLRLGNAE